MRRTTLTELVSMTMASPSVWKKSWVTLPSVTTQSQLSEASCATFSQALGLVLVEPLS